MWQSMTSQWKRLARFCQDEHGQISAQHILKDLWKLWSKVWFQQIIKGYQLRLSLTQLQSESNPWSKVKVKDKAKTTLAWMHRNTIISLVGCVAHIQVLHVWTNKNHECSTSPNHAYHFGCHWVEILSRHRWVDHWNKPVSSLISLTQSCNLLLMSWWHFNDWLHFLLVVSLLGKWKERPCYVHRATESHVLSDNQWSILTFGWHFSHLVQNEVAMLKEHSAVWMTVLSYLNRNRAGVHKKCATMRILIHFPLLKSLDGSKGLKC